MVLSQLPTQMLQMRLGPLHTIMNEREMTSEQLDEWLKGHCNRYANGACCTRACLVRGGYTTGPVENFDIATCEEHEIGMLARQGLQPRKVDTESDDFTKNLNKYVRRGEHSIFETLDNLAVQLAEEKELVKGLEGNLKACKEYNEESRLQLAQMEAKCRGLASRVEDMGHHPDCKILRVVKRIRSGDSNDADVFGDCNCGLEKLLSTPPSTFLREALEPVRSDLEKLKEYNFECEAGPLQLCVPFMQAIQRLANLIGGKVTSKDECRCGRKLITDGEKSAHICTECERGMVARLFGLSRPAGT